MSRNFVANAGTYLTPAEITDLRRKSDAVGGRQLGLAILMHDAAHGLLFRNRRVNDWAGQWLCGWPVVADMMLYRPYHLQHHRLTQQRDDPDLTLSAPLPITRASQ